MCVVRISGTYSCLFLIKSLRCNGIPRGDIRDMSLASGSLQRTHLITKSQHKIQHNRVTNQRLVGARRGSTPAHDVGLCLSYNEGI